MLKSLIAVSNNLYDGIYDDMGENFVFIKDKDKLNVGYLEQISPEYIFFPHWSYIIPPEIYENFNCVIFHMTDLPFGRGGSPLQNLISRGIYQTKISALKCCKEIDAGDIYLKNDFDISSGSAECLYHEAGYVVKEMIKKIITEKPRAVAQTGEVVTFSRRKPEESCLQGRDSARQIYDYIRMLDAPGYPKAFIDSGKIRYEFYSAEINDNEVVAKVIIRDNNND